MGETGTLKRPTKWTEKIIIPHKIGDTPPLNKDGYWKKKKPETFKVNNE